MGHRFGCRVLGTLTAIFALSLLASPSATAAAWDDLKPDDKGTAELEDAKAREVLRAQESNLASKEPRLKTEGLKVFTQQRSSLFVSRITKLLKDRDAKVVAAACEALGNQPYDKSQSALLKLLRDPKKSRHPEIGAAAITALGRVGWSKSGYAQLRDLWDASPKEVKRALAAAFGAQKEKQAFSLLVDNMAEPAPDNPNSASNPPASYWRKRWTEWNYYKREVRVALQEVTGESFQTQEQAIEWAKSGPGRKLKYKYKRGS